MNCVTDAQPTSGPTPSVNSRAAVAARRSSRGEIDEGVGRVGRRRHADEHREELERAVQLTDQAIPGQRRAPLPSPPRSARRRSRSCRFLRERRAPRRRRPSRRSASSPAPISEHALGKLFAAPSVIKEREHADRVARQAVGNDASRLIAYCIRRIYRTGRGSPCEPRHTATGCQPPGRHPRIGSAPVRAPVRRSLHRVITRFRIHVVRAGGNRRRSVGQYVRRRLDG